MFIVTVVGANGERDGCLIGFATQCSIHPPRFIACVSKENRTFDAVQAAEAIVVHFLGAEQGELARLFGGETGDEVDKFELCRWSEGPFGIPVLDDVPGWFAGRILQRQDAGDHVALLLDPTQTEDRGGAVDLGFQDVKGIHPGHPVP
jgi:flavin reductase (DIM6/NTAB) family NADH-FMN oxidoreductase RutF